MGAPRGSAKTDGVSYVSSSPPAQPTATELGYNPLAEGRIPPPPIEIPAMFANIGAR